MKDAISQIDDRDLDRVAAIIRSMTPAERQDPKILNGSRRLRIARGSGVTVNDVNQLVIRFGEARKVMKQMGGMAGMPGMRRATKKGKKGKGARAGGSNKGGRGPMRPGAPSLPGGVNLPNLPPGLNLPPGMSLPPGLSPDLSNLKLPDDPKNSE
jgi:signal recognition particle subunit SRP54